jgi:hypothetical protein
MNYDKLILLILLQFAHIVVGLVLPVVLVRRLRKPHDWWWRAGVAGVICWVGLILLATLQHYSVGNADRVIGSGDNHEAVAERGWSVENNQILFMLVTGWAMPAMMLLAVALHRRLMHDDATS